MKARKAPFLSPIARICCSILGHDYRVSKVITNHIREYKCNLCGEEVTDTADGTIEKLTSQFKETNDFLAQYYQKRTKRHVLHYD